MFIDEECGNLKVVNDRGERNRSIEQRKKSNVLQSCRRSLSDRCCRRVFIQ